ncbi:MAG: alpha/beta hydrolase [Moraxellaceae bacterium]|nr:alpha/beta hydrolase [Moraxellaceae bacterium]
MSWQSRILNGVLKRTMKPVMFSGRLTRARMGISAWSMEASAALIPSPLANFTRVKQPVHGEWVETGEDTSRVILYLHGGAYIAGSPRTHRPLTVMLARKAGARVFALDYRQAPEHAFPAWLEDSVAAYRHLLQRGERPENIVFAGDSAGGNLVLVTLLKLRELGLPQPAGAICLSPWTDLSCSSRSFRQNVASEAMLNAAAIAALGRHHIGRDDPKNPLLSPAHGNFDGLPPLMVHVGGEELLLDDARTVRRNAQRARLQIDYREWPGMPHVFPLFYSLLPEAREAMQEMAAFVIRVTARPQLTNQG